MIIFIFFATFSKIMHTINPKNRQYLLSCRIFRHLGRQTEYFFFLFIESTEKDTRYASLRNGGRLRFDLDAIVS